jgi:hypothetical protein
MLSLADRYKTRLQEIPSPGGGGCHVALLGVANLGIMAGADPEEIFADIRQAIPMGKRRVSDKEIREAIQRATVDHQCPSQSLPPKSKPVVKDGKSALQEIIDQGETSSLVDLWESSPIRLLNEPRNDAILFLSNFYSPTDLIWIGERHQPGVLGRTIRTREEWIQYFQSGGATAPFIIINPLNGIPSPLKSGEKETLRGDGNVLSFRYALVEFDSLGLEEQIRFWSVAKLPVLVLIHSGGKSIHAWLEVSGIENLEDWASEIKAKLYDRLLGPLGVDGSCCNAARLARLPGHFRAEKNEWQKILWLSPGVNIDDKRF